MSLEQDVEKLLHPIASHVRDALSAAEAKFEGEKAAIAAEVRAGLSAGKAAVKAETPELLATAEAAAKAVADAVEAALVARGL